LEKKKKRFDERRRKRQKEADNFISLFNFPLSRKNGFLLLLFRLQKTIQTISNRFIERGRREREARRRKREIRRDRKREIRRDRKRDKER